MLIKELFVAIFVLNLPYVTYTQKESFLHFFSAYSVDSPRLLNDHKVTRGCKECPKIYIPVCGDNNITYTNECKMLCANLKRKTPVKKFRKGPCEIFPEW